MTEYRLLSQNSVNMDCIARLERTVQHAVHDGWCPCGGVSITYDRHLNKHVAAQAMVRDRTGITFDVVDPGGDEE